MSCLIICGGDVINLISTRISIHIEYFSNNTSNSKKIETYPFDQLLNAFFFEDPYSDPVIEVYNPDFEGNFLSGDATRGSAPTKP